MAVRAESRIGLLGFNGSGKSTLIKVLSGQLDKLSGTLTKSKNLRIGYYAQHQVDVLDPSATPVEIITNPASRSAASSLGTEQEIRDFLGGFHFHGSKADEAIGDFSGGEKTRLALAKVVSSKPNLLLLDEPTNHLDMEMRQALTVALQGFGGAILLISHDRHLLANTVDEFLIIDNGILDNFKGDLEDYRRSVLKSSSPRSKKQENKEKGLPRLDRKEIKNEIISLEKILKRLNRKLKEVEDYLNNPKSYEKDEDLDFHTLLRDQVSLTNEIELSEEQGLDLNQKLEEG